MQQFSGVLLKIASSIAVEIRKQLTMRPNDRQSQHVREQATMANSIFSSQ